MLNSSSTTSLTSLTSRSGAVEKLRDPFSVSPVFEEISRTFRNSRNWLFLASISAERSIVLVVGGAKLRGDFPAVAQHTQTTNMETVDVVLVCSGTGETENGSLTFSNPPQIVKDIKLAVEEKFNIPAFCQALSFDSHILRDDQKLSYTRARSGDTFHVRYHSKADCAKIKEVIGWLGQLVSGFKNETPTISNGISLELQLILRSRVGRALGANLFITGAYGSPSLSNRHYFHHHGGTDTILEVYRAILRNPWNVTPYYIKLIECRILSALWNFTADSTDNFAMRNHLVSVGAMEMLMKSLLRVRIGEEECIGADLAIRGERYTLVYLLENAVGVISK